MKLWTSQSASAWRELQKTGVLRAPLSVTSAAEPDGDNFKFAYDWMREQMRKRGVKPDPVDPNQYPLWAWRDHVVAYEEWARYKRRSKFWTVNNVFLEIELPDDHVLLSDYHLWHLVLNGQTANARQRSLWERLVLDLEWRTARERPRLGEVLVQATFWELRMDQVRVIEQRPVMR